MTLRGVCILVPLPASWRMIGMFASHLSALGKNLELRLPTPSFNQVLTFPQQVLAHWVRAMVTNIRKTTMTAGSFVWPLLSAECLTIRWTSLKYVFEGHNTFDLIYYRLTCWVSVTGLPVSFSERIHPLSSCDNYSKWPANVRLIWLVYIGRVCLTRHLGKTTHATSTQRAAGTHRQGSRTAGTLTTRVWHIGMMKLPLARHRAAGKVGCLACLIHRPYFPSYPVSAWWWCSVSTITAPYSTELRWKQFFFWLFRLCDEIKFP